MKTPETKVMVGIGVVVLGLFAIGAYEKTKYDKIRLEERNRVRQHELDMKEKEASFPPEYWNAKVAEHEASIKKHEIDIAMRERLELDKRDRETAEKDAIREFEKNAPDSYWNHKKLVEEETTKRRQIAADEERARRLDERERDIAKRNAEAIEAGAKSIEKALNSKNFVDFNLV